jgi:hypothetical protein
MTQPNNASPDIETLAKRFPAVGHAAPARAFMLIVPAGFALDDQ